MKATEQVLEPTDSQQTIRRMLAESRVGRQLAERWTLERLLGIGGSASVYQAKHRNGRSAAVKILHSELSANPSACRRFVSEGRAANQVGHPGAVAVLDDGTDADGTRFLVMELLQGCSLAQLLKEQGSLSVADAAFIGVRVLDVLAAAHERGIVHRDIKPSNLFRTEQGDIKVLDFGVARLREFDDFATLSGAVLGTPAFMAPELASGKFDEVDARTDLWAVGATLFQLLTGGTVHHSRSTNEALIVAATCPAPSVASRRPDVPAALAHVIDRALRFDRDERWPDARTMRAVLGTFVQPVDQGLAVTVPEGERIAPRRALPTKRIAAVLGGIAVLVVSWWITRPAVSVLAASPPVPPAPVRSEPVRAEPSKPQVAPAPAASEPVVGSAVVSSPKAPAKRQLGRTTTIPQVLVVDTILDRRK